MEPQQVVAIIVPVLVILVLVAGTLFARRRGFNVGSAQTIVRCLEGHLFTTIWFPGFHSRRFDLARFVCSDAPSVIT